MTSLGFPPWRDVRLGSAVLWWHWPFVVSILLAGLAACTNDGQTVHRTGRLFGTVGQAAYGYPMMAPPPREFAAITGGAGTLVLFGGQTVVPIGSNYRDLDDMWVFGAKGWRQFRSEPVPSPRADAALAYDRRGDLILFGGMQRGANGGGHGLADTWAFDNARWKLVGTGSAEPPWEPSTPPMALDKKTGELTLLAPPPAYGGSHAELGEFEALSSDGPFATWTWNEARNVWIVRDTTTGPPLDSYTDAAMAFDAPSGDLISTITRFHRRNAQLATCLLSETSRFRPAVHWTHWAYGFPKLGVGMEHVGAR